MRSHEKSKYAWTDVFFGPNNDKVHVIDKSTLKIVKTLAPAPVKMQLMLNLPKMVSLSCSVSGIWMETYRI